MKTLESLIKLLIVVLTLLLVSCEEKIDLEVIEAGDPVLVVDGIITSDTTAHVVNLSYSGGFFLDDKTPRASGARVAISDNQGNRFELYETETGKYSTADTVAGKVGVEYTLHIELDGQLYQASSLMPRVPEIDSLSYRWDNYMQSYRILLYGQEPSGKGDHYMWHLYKNAKKVTQKINQLMVVEDEFLDGNYIGGFEVDYWDMEFNFQPGDTVCVAMHSISPVAFEFIAGVFQEHNSGQAAMRPPSNIPSNVSNQALGLFHASAVTSKTIIIE